MEKRRHAAFHKPNQRARGPRCFIENMRMTACFADRLEAGRYLAEKLEAYRHRDDVVVLALPRGGVPVAYEVATRLHVPLDVFIVRKLGIPGWEELAMGAIASGGVRVVNEEVVQHLQEAEKLLEMAAAKETVEIERQEREYRDGRPPRDLRGCTVILVDDGLATGSTMRAAVKALRQHGVAKIVVAVPVGAPETCAEFKDEVDEAICAVAPESFHAVGQFYEDFLQTTDEEVRDLLAAAAEAEATATI
jgi:predicted phosphoribosyltransferase